MFVAMFTSITSFKINTFSGVCANVYMDFTSRAKCIYSI